MRGHEWMNEKMVRQFNRHRKDREMIDIQTVRQIDDKQTDRQSDT